MNRLNDSFNFKATRKPKVEFGDFGGLSVSTFYTSDLIRF